MKSKAKTFHGMLKAAERCLGGGNYSRAELLEGFPPGLDYELLRAHLQKQPGFKKRWEWAFEAADRWRRPAEVYTVTYALGFPVTEEMLEDPKP